MLVYLLLSIAVIAATVIWWRFCRKIIQGIPGGKSRDIQNCAIIPSNLSQIELAAELSEKLTPMIKNENKEDDKLDKQQLLLTDPNQIAGELSLETAEFKDDDEFDDSDSSFLIVDQSPAPSPTGNNEKKEEKKDPMLSVKPLKEDNMNNDNDDLSIKEDSTNHDNDDDDDDAVAATETENPSNDVDDDECSKAEKKKNIRLRIISEARAIITEKIVKEKNKSEKELDDEKSDDDYLNNEKLNMEKAEDYKSQGNVLYKEGKIDDALELYTKALYCCSIEDISSELTIVTLCNRAACYLTNKNYQHAINDATDAINLDENFVKAFIRRFRGYEGLEKWHDALSDLNKAIELDPSLKLKYIIEHTKIEQKSQEQFEKEKQEMMDKLKTFGNWALGKVGLSLENFKLEQNPDTGSYNISFQQNK